MLAPLVVFLSMLLPTVAIGQSPFSIELYQVKMEDHVVTDTVGLIPNGGAVYVGGDPCLLLFKKNPTFKLKDKYYVTVLDFQPDGGFSQVYPTPFQPPSEITVDSNTQDIWTLPSSILTFTPPYGKERFLVLYSKIPLSIKKPDPFQVMGSSKYFTEAERGELSPIDLEWIMSGSPPEALKGELFFDEFQFEIRPLDLQTDRDDSENPEVDDDLERRQDSGTIGTAPDAHDQLDRGNGGGSPGQDGKTVERHQIPNNDVYIKYPVMTFISPPEPSYIERNRGIEVEEFATETQSFILKGTLSCKNTVKSVEVRVSYQNGSDTAPLPEHYTVHSFKSAPHATLFEQQIQLRVGLNTVKVIAYTENSGVSQVLKLQCKPKAVSTKGEDYLLAIGIDKYIHWPALQNAVSDAHAVSQALMNHYGIDSSKVITLSNSACTKRGIDSVFRRLITKLNPEDRIIVYFAGHGYYDKVLDEGYWIPVNGENDQWSTDSYIPNSTISKYIKSLPTRHTLFISDACFSGSYCVGDNRGAELYVETMDKSKSRWIFTSGRMQQVADEYENTGHSPFAYFLLNYLNQPAKHVFLISEMASVVTRNVGTNSEQTPMARAIRNSGDEGGEFVFRFE